jgi:hypothetical protein
MNYCSETDDNDGSDTSSVSAASTKSQHFGKRPSYLEEPMGETYMGERYVENS